MFPPVVHPNWALFPPTLYYPTLSAFTIRSLYRSLLRESSRFWDAHSRTYLLNRIRRDFRVENLVIPQPRYGRPNKKDYRARNIAAGSFATRANQVNEAESAIKTILKANGTSSASCMHIMELAYGRYGAVQEELLAPISAYGGPAFEALVLSQVNKQRLEPTILEEEELTPARVKTRKRKFGVDLLKCLRPPLPNSWRSRLERYATSPRPGGDTDIIARQTERQYGHTVWMTRRRACQRLLDSVPVIIKRIESIDHTATQKDPEKSVLDRKNSPSGLAAIFPGISETTHVSLLLKRLTLPSGISYHPTPTFPLPFPALLPSSRITLCPPSVSNEIAPGTQLLRELVPLGDHIVIGKSPASLSVVARNRRMRDFSPIVSTWGMAQEEVEDAAVASVVRKKDARRSKRAEESRKRGRFSAVGGLPVAEFADVDRDQNMA